MDNATKVFLIIGAVVVSLLVLTFGFGLTRGTIEKGNGLTNDVNDKIDNVLESQYTQYDATEVSGSQVLNVISETYFSSEPIYITVVTSAGSTVTYVCDTTTLTRDPSTTHSTKITAAKSKANNAYITPTGTFVGTVNRNTNQAIVGITFTQR